MEKRTRNRRRGEETENNGRLWKLVSKVGLGLVVVLIVLTAMQCTVKSPEAPEWDTSLAVPVINRTYTMQELIDKADQDGLVIDSNNNVIYTMDYDIDTVKLDNGNLSVNDVSYAVSEVMGPIELDAPSIAPVSTPIDDIGPLSMAVPGVVPPASFTVQNDLPLIGNFSSATISNGTMLVIVSNNLGVNLDTVNIVMFDITNSTMIDSYAFPGGLSTGQTDTASFVLDGKTMSNSLRFEAHCHNEPATILTASNKELSCSTEFVNGLSVSSATAHVPSLDPINFSQQADLNNSANQNLIQSAELSSGNLSLTVANNTALDATLMINLPDLDSSGASFSFVQVISAGANAVINRDISNYTLRPTDQTLPQAIDIDVTALVPGSGSSFVAVSEADDFSVVADLTNLQFGSVTGLFEQTDATFDQIVEQVDVPTGFDGISPVSTIIELEIANGVELPGYINLTLSNGAGKTLVVQDSVLAGVSGNPTTTIISVIDSSFLSPIPDSIIFTGSATFGDGVSAGTIAADDFVFARVNITAPIEAIITETNLDTDIESESINQGDIDLITDHVNEARFIYTITNHLPIGASIQILFGGDTTTIPNADNQVITEYLIGGNGELTVQAAPTVGGIVPIDSVATLGEQMIVISNSDLGFLENDPLFIGTLITLAGSNGLPVKLTSNDYITITGYIEVDYHVDDNF